MAKETKGKRSQGPRTALRSLQDLEVQIRQNNTAPSVIDI